MFCFLEQFKKRFLMFLKIFFYVFLYFINVVFLLLLKQKRT